jgi:hypothetical protein
MSPSPSSLCSTWCRACGAKGFNTPAVSSIVIGLIMHIDGRRQKRTREIAWWYICLSITLILMATQPAQAYTTEVHVVKYASDNTSIINETTVNYSWMEAKLPVQGNGISHYYFQGPVFEDEWEETYNLTFTGTWGSSEELWDRIWNSSTCEYEQREQVNCYPNKDLGACKGTDIRDLCNLVGGMREEDTVKILANDGVFKMFPYSVMYNENPHLGPYVLTWYSVGAGESGATSGYTGANYTSGMRCMFFADTSRNPWKKHIAGIGDMVESIPPEYYHYYVNLPVFYPSLGGYSIKEVNRIYIYSHDEPPILDSITLAPASGVVYRGETLQFSATARDQYGQVMTGRTYSWRSSNETVGTITNTGLFEAHAVGATTITAANGTIEGTATITVEEEPILTTIAISPYFPAVYHGSAQQLEATAYDQHGNEVSNISFVWASSNESIGTVDLGGLFQALAPGTTEITVTNGSINGSTIATVLPIPLALWGPYVTNTTSSSATVHWKTENATGGTVKYANVSYYAEHGDYDRSVEDGVEKQFHHLTLTELTPDTVYHYQVEVENRSTGECSFRTFPLNGSFTFIVYSDSQEPQGEPGITQLNRHRLVADRIAGEDNVSFVLHCGDLVNDGGDLSEWNRFFEAARAMMAMTTFYPTLGNHEYTNFSGSGEAVQNYYDVFDMPQWYSFDCGDAHVSVLDSNEETNESAQTAWLQADLTTSATWKFVSFHHPPYSSSSTHFGGWTDLRELWCTLFHNNSVNAVFNGHVHAYERLRANGITYVVLGTGGGPPYTLNETKLPESRSSLENTLGYVRVTVDAENDTVKMVFIPVADCSGGEPVLFEPGTAFETAIISSPPGALDTDISANPYPSIAGTYRGTITVSPEHDISASRLYTYPCPGTGGHTEFVRIEKGEWNVTAIWDGYRGDWQTIRFDTPIILWAEETYNYTLVTGSYPQIIHARNHTTLDGSVISCTEFVDANNRRYTEWIPAMRLE